MGYSHWRANPRLVRAIVNESGATIAWLQKQGVVFTDATTIMPDAPRTYHVIKGKGEAVIKTLTTAAKEKGVDIRLSTPVKRILKQGNRISEVVVEVDGEETCSKSGQSDFLMAMFSSPLTWDDKTKTPSDASVTLFYSREKEHLVKDVQEFGLWWLHNQEAVARKRRVKCFWSMEAETQNLGNATFCQWVFKLSGTWPKTGKLMAFALPQARVFLHLMWEDCGSATFRPIMESIGKSFRNQEVFLGIASHDSNSHLGSTV